MTSYHEKCSKCGKVWHLHLLDAKDDGTGNFEILEGPCCYGVGWTACTTVAGHEGLTQDEIDAAFQAHAQTTQKERK